MTNNRSRDLGEYRENFEQCLDNLTLNVKNLLSIHPASNAQLHRELGIMHPKGTRGDYLLWHIWHNVTKDSVRIGNNEGSLATEDVVRNYEDCINQEERNIKIKNIMIDTQTNVAQMYNIVQEVLKEYPGEYYQNSLERDLGVDKVWGDTKGHRGEIGAFFFKTMEDNGGAVISDYRGTSKIYDWVGDTEYKMRDESVASPTRTISSGEALVARILEKKEIKHTKQKTFSTCKNPSTGRLLRYDFYIDDYDMIIEVHGAQHYQHVPRFHKTVEDYNAALVRDVIKKNWAEKEGKGFYVIDARPGCKIEKQLMDILEEVYGL